MPVAISATVILGSALAGATVGVTLGYKAGCYATWRLVTWRLTRS